MKRSSVHIGNTKSAAIPAIEAWSFAEMMKVFTDLTKFRITALVSFTTGLGYILAANELSFTMFYVIAGIFLLAAASSSLNHWQEQKTDALMERTKLRPIPSGRIEPASAVYVSLGLLISGSVLLLAATNFTTFAVGLFTFFWYNGVYTPLKRKTACRRRALRVALQAWRFSISMTARIRRFTPGSRRRSRLRSTIR